MRLWLDVEDLFHYAMRNPRPSGIQRLSFELYAALEGLPEANVRFVRHDPVGGTLRTVPWSVIRDLFDELLASPVPSKAVEAPLSIEPMPDGGYRRGLRRLSGSLPLSIRDPLAQAYAAQRLVISAQGSALRHGVRVIRELPSLVRRPPGTSTDPVTGAPVAGEDIRDTLQPGDVFGVLGSPWFHPNYADFTLRLTRDRGARTALLVYDLIPLLRPEWCDRGLVRVFTEWFSGFIPHVDHVFAISESSARDVERWAEATRTPVSLPVRPIPIGTGFTGPAVEAAATLPAGLQAGEYALIVSTIEARKNHLLAFRVWRQMLDEMPGEEVPTLVFAGRQGWLVADLMQQLTNCAYLDGKIVVVSDPSDAELVALYRGCRFTLFPSLYEGWGLPVTESLSFGKLCVASDRTSIPEAGGPFCLYLDPDSVTTAKEVIRRACRDDALVAAAEAKIRDEFHPTPWRASAEAIVRHLQR